MSELLNQPLLQMKTMSKKIIAGSVLAVAFALFSVGMAAAAPMDKPSKDECSQAGYSNYGQCVQAWAQQNGNGNDNDNGNGNGGAGAAANGYGGSNIHVEVYGDFIVNVYNFFFA